MKIGRRKKFISGAVPLPSDIQKHLAHMVRTVGLRGTARSSGLSPTGVKKLLDRGACYPVTLHNVLQPWFLQQQKAPIEQREVVARELLEELGYVVSKP